MKSFFVALCFTIAFGLTCSSPSAIAAEGLKVGDKVPDFKSTDDKGKVWDSKDYIGKNIVVFYFYPADMTGGCTKQACSYRDNKSELTKLGVEVVGVSGDSAKNHALFKKAHNLNFTLLADEKGKMAKMFGVRTKKGGSITKLIDGNQEVLVRGVTTARWTFVVDKNGKVIHKDMNAKPNQDTGKVISLVKKMQ